MESISKTIKELIQKDPYYGVFACGINKYYSDNIERAGICLNGINFDLIINKGFWDSLNSNQRLGVIKHEMLHIIFFHVAMREEITSSLSDYDIFNLAADCEVNCYLPEEWMYPNPVTINDYGFEPCKGTLYYFKELKSLQQNNSSSGEDNIISNSGVNNSHSQWNTGDSLSSELKNLVQSQIEFQMQNAAKAMKNRGCIPSEIQEKLSQIKTLQPPSYNWKQLLRKSLGFSYDIYTKKTRRKESLRFEESFGLKKKKKHNLLVAIDTSGSINTNDFYDFFNEIQHIYKQGANVKILECDTQIQKEYDYKGKVPKAVKGRGGTDFLPCIEYFNKHRNFYTTLIYFTDGYAPTDEIKLYKPMIWVLSKDYNEKNIYPGKVIKIK